MAHQLERAERRRGRRTAAAAAGGVSGCRVVGEVQRFDRHHVALDGEGAQQQLGEPAGPPRSRARAGRARRCRGTMRVSATEPAAMTSSTPGGGREQAGQVADRQLDPVEDLGQRHQLAELGEPAQRLHPPDHGIERLALTRGGAERARGPVERAGDERALARHERADATVELAVRSPARRPGEVRAGGAAGERLEARARAAPCARSPPRPTRAPGEPAGETPRPPARPAPAWPDPTRAGRRGTRAPAPSRPAAARAIGCWPAMSAEPRSTASRAEKLVGGRTVGAAHERSRADRGIPRPRARRSRRRRGDWSWRP